jgi:hypothetical protein
MCCIWSQQVQAAAAGVLMQQLMVVAAAAYSCRAIKHAMMQVLTSLVLCFSRVCAAVHAS